VIDEPNERLDAALASVRLAAESIHAALADINPEEVKVEFGLKLEAEAGAVIAKTGVEGHFTVSLTWPTPDLADPSGPLRRMAVGIRVLPGVPDRPLPRQQGGNPLGRAVPGCLCTASAESLKTWGSTPILMALRSLVEVPGSACDSSPRGLM